MTADHYSLAERLGQYLNARRLKVTTAESCTGGGVAHAITMVPGSSQWFEYGFVTYSNEAKQALLNVDPALVQQHGAVSREVVIAMAQGAAHKAAADLAVAVSGIAGPGGGSAQKPVGTVWFAWRHPLGIDSEVRRFAGDREAVRDQAVLVALQGLIQVLANTV